jgi:hypothetical protein
MKLQMGIRYEYATTYLEEFAETITSTAELVVPEIAARLRALLQPAMGTEQEKIQIFVALVKDGAADVGVQRVSAATFEDDPTRFIPGVRHYIMAGDQWVFYGHGACLERLHDPAVATPLQVVRIARELMQAGIDFERDSHADAKSRTIGGDIDAIVIAPGACPFGLL